MKYKNITKGNLKFRANDKNGLKKVFELKPNEEIESDRIVSFGGLEEIKEEKIKKTNPKKEVI